MRRLPIAGWSMRRKAVVWSGTWAAGAAALGFAQSPAPGIGDWLPGGDDHQGAVAGITRAQPPGAGSQPGPENSTATPGPQPPAVAGAGGASVAQGSVPVNQAPAGTVDVAGETEVSLAGPGAWDVTGLRLIGAMPGTSRATNFAIGHEAGRAVLTMELERVSDRPGPYGGRLSPKLRARITNRDSGAVFYDGPVLGMPDLDLGQSAAGDQRRVRLELRFPDGGPPAGERSGDNAVQGARSDILYRFTARAAEQG